MFIWLLKLTGISGILTWLSIAVIHLRFRAAYLAQGFDLKDLPYRARFFPYSNYYAILLGLVILVGQGVVAAQGSDSPLLSIFVTYRNAFSQLTFP